MSIRENVSSSLKEAMKKKDVKLINALRLIIAGIKEKDISSKGKGNSSGISEIEIISLLQTMIKQRNASIEMYVKGKREDLANLEKNENIVIATFLPEQLTKKEIDQIIINTIKTTESNSIKDMGKVISFMKDKYNGKMDLGVVSKMIKERLN